MVNLKFDKVTHVLFDLDGLLLDSEGLYGEAYKRVCARYGAEFTWELHASVLGFQGQEVVAKIIETFNLPTSKEAFLQEVQQECSMLLPDAKLMPGAEKLVKHLHKHGIPIALATSSSEDSVRTKMQNHKEFLGYFHHLTMGSTDPEVTRGKPDPSIFLVCASRFPDKPKPEDCLVFEDAVNGMKAANAANMQVVVVPDARIDKNLFQSATLVLDSLEEFKPEQFDLPAYD
ncbi:pseudouridine-5'-phosphatase-like [Epargyreus clarus]|uniref:pseudouridine-5'-phosphatase-like n=1 Tax=Epargyreus clarus TaxID=520877 RepID=UPI003C2CF7D7